LLVRDQFGEHLMRYWRERQAYTGLIPVLLLLSGCGAAEPDCNSADSRAAVIKSMSGNSNNAPVDDADAAQSAASRNRDPL
jgi:hypothetical protein